MLARPICCKRAREGMASLENSGSPGTTFAIAWAATVPEDPVEWEHIARGTLLLAESRIQLPVRGGGFWLLWLANLPERPDGSYQTRITDIRFTS